MSRSTSQEGRSRFVRTLLRLTIPCSIMTLFFLAAPLVATLQDDPVLLGKGSHRYKWIRGWGKLPDGMSYGNTHGVIVTDSKGLIYVNTDSENAIIVYDADGKLVRSFGAEFKGGAHGMTLVQENGAEYIYLAHTGRHEVAKLTLEGEVVWTLGVPEASKIYQSANEYRPTSVAIGPDGAIFVADGYGKSWVHKFDAERNYLKSFGGPGSEPGQMRTPHGIWIDRRSGESVLGVADRENGRLQFFTLDGELIGVVMGTFRRPCNAYPKEGHLLVPDLAGRVTILDERNLLISHLGDNPDPSLRAQNGVPREQWVDGYFISPHGACWDAAGDLYVLDWLSTGRITKLQRVH